MAASQFVIAGRVNCDQYARLEAAADYFQSRLPSFRVHKEPQTAFEWPCFLRRTCTAQGWHLPVDSGGPLVWRLLVQRGGRGLLVGGLSEFLQLAAVYYGLTPPEISPTVARQMAAHTAGQLELERKQQRQARVALERRLTSVAVLGSPLSGAASHFLAALAAGSVLGKSTPLRLQLLGDPALPALAALRYELHDLASPNLGQVALLRTVREAVRNASVIIVLDPIPNVLLPEPPEPTPPPTPPAEEPPPTPAARTPSPGKTERDSAAEPAPPAATPASSSPTPPQINLAPSDDDRLPGDLAPSRGARGGSAPRSGDSRKLSVIVEDPDSEEKEEEVMEQLMESRRGSSRRSGARSRGSTAGSAPSDSATDPAAAAAGVTNGVPSPLATNDNSNGGSATPGQTAAGSGGSRPTSDDSPSDRETDAAGWLAPPPDDQDDSDVTHEELAELFCRMRAYAEAIDATASRRCRVVVAGGRLPCLAATVLLLHLPRLPRTNVIALCQPRINQLRALLADRLGVAPHDIHGLAEWGNPPAGRVWLDLDAAAVSRHKGAVLGPPGYRRPLLEVLYQPQWLAEQLPRLLAARAGSALRPAGAEVSALPLAVCLADTLRRWWAGADDGQLESLGVASEGEFGVPEQLVLAAPARLIAGDFRVCRAMPLTGEGEAAVRAAVHQMIGWLWQFGIRLSPSGRHCTLSACPSSTVSCCGSGERLLSASELTSGSDEKAANTEQQQGGAEGDGAGTTEPGPPPAPDTTETEKAAGGEQSTSAESGKTPATPAGSDQRPSDRAESGNSGPRPGPAQGERTSISGGDERRGSTKDGAATTPSEETGSSASREKTPATDGAEGRGSAEVATPASAGEQSLGSAGSAAAGSTPAEEGKLTADAARTASPGRQGTPDGGSSSGDERRRSDAPRRKSLTAEGERDYIPVQPDQ